MRHVGQHDAARRRQPVALGLAYAQHAFDGERDLDRVVVVRRYHRHAPAGADPAALPDVRPGRPAGRGRRLKPFGLRFHDSRFVQGLRRVRSSRPGA